MMPFFIDHNRQLVADYIRNCLKEDEKNYCRKFYEQVFYLLTNFIDIDVKW